MSHQELTKPPCSEPAGIGTAHERLVRLVYVDESGMCVRDAVLLVAAVIIHADQHYRAVEAHFEKLRRTYIKEEHRFRFCFHAKDIYSGSGPVFGGRNCYTVAERCAILKELLSIPAKFGLAVVFGFTHKEASQAGWIKERKLLSLRTDHEAAFALCALEAERYLKHCTPGEIAKIIAEDNTTTKKGIKRVYDLFRGTHPRETANYSPLHSIVDAMSFENKDDAPLLQIADACAFFLRHFIEKQRNDIDQFISSISPKGATGINVFEYSKTGGSGWISA